MARLPVSWQALSPNATIRWAASPTSRSASSVHLLAVSSYPSWAAQASPDSTSTACWLRSWVQSSCCSSWVLFATGRSDSPYTACLPIIINSERCANRAVMSGRYAGCKSTGISSSTAPAPDRAHARATGTSNGCKHPVARSGLDKDQAGAPTAALATSSACSKSAMMSSTFSQPTETRTSSSR